MKNYVCSVHFKRIGIDILTEKLNINQCLQNLDEWESQVGSRLLDLPCVQSVGKKGVFLEGCKDISGQGSLAP